MATGVVSWLGLGGVSVPPRALLAARKTRVRVAMDCGGEYMARTGEVSSYNVTRGFATTKTNNREHLVFGPRKTSDHSIENWIAAKTRDSRCESHAILLADCTHMEGIAEWPYPDQAYS